MDYELEGPRPRSRPKRTWIEVVEKDCQARTLNITPILSRTFEHVIVREFIYPESLEPPTQLFHGSICFLSNWIHDRSYNCHFTVCYGIALVQLVCSGYQAGLKYGL